MSPPQAALCGVGAGSAAAVLAGFALMTIVAKIVAERIEPGRSRDEVK